MQTRPAAVDDYVFGPDSKIHGQKFWGFRVVAAFLMTVIFMSLLLFMVNGPLGVKPWPQRTVAPG